LLFGYISSAYNCKGLTAKSLNWESILPPKTRLKFQLRTADSKQALKKSKWLGPSGPDSFYESSGTDINNLEAADWIQYRVVFDTYNGANAPVLEKVQIHFE